MDVAVTGSSGLIGTALVDALRAGGHRVVRVVRGAPGAPTADAVGWDPKAGTIDAARLEGVGAVVHLAGAGIGDRRWNDAYKREIVDSRVQGTGLLARTLAGLTRPPAVLVSASAVGWYGDRGDEVLDETSGPGTGFLAEVCQQWEARAGAVRPRWASPPGLCRGGWRPADPAREAGIRVAHIRSGVVLSPRGGA